MMSKSRINVEAVLVHFCLTLTFWKKLTNLTNGEKKYKFVMTVRVINPPLLTSDQHQAQGINVMSM